MLNIRAVAGLLCGPLLVCAQMAADEPLRVYAALVVKEPLTEIATEFERAGGRRISLIFDTAGATAQRFRADSGSALLITTADRMREAIGAEAAREGASISLGRTVARFAVHPSSPKPDVSTGAALRSALLAARRIAVSDPARGATVGAHFLKVIESLGVKEQVLAKTTFAPDGVATMRLVLDGTADLGVTQSSEVLQAHPGAMAGPFPGEHALATEFLLWRGNRLPAGAEAFVEALTGAAGRAKLATGGLMPVERR